MKVSKFVFICVVALICSCQAFANYHVKYDFNNQWTGDYAPGWENTDFAGGEDPTGVMMQFAYAGLQGSGAVRIIATDTPDDSYWWADVNPTNVDEAAMAKQYNPWVSAWYWDEGYNSESGNTEGLHRGGQIFAVPDTQAGSGDWSDTQLGAGINSGDQYYYAYADNGGTTVAGTDTVRSEGWHQLKLQLSSDDGKIHYYIDGQEVGATVRDDYDNLLGFGLSTVFTNPLSEWSYNYPWSVWDDFEYGSSIPEPTTIALLGFGSAIFIRRRRA
ncbi:hypothetical protein STSP2_01475 [Anaerohalosphaera lusitana]|uniref:Ice-binding protein C-terminal domain-containing protein n=1 Tax=Anaerohalosphaera lusitana TaxID=1936003 RepID=A0A1U9NLD5_9BACT|nr:PEP-CTERM sorting domain-containing protein [Anaerohalosphaera lusitana]AQT68316.1 hypothetical protein STSP2_01475 [Anaerohalosphaera lusitana]